MLNYLLGVVFVGTAGLIVHYGLLFFDKHKPLPPASPKEEMMYQEMKPVARYEDSA